MKRLLCAALSALLLLSGCGQRAPANESPPGEGPTVSMEATPAIGRSYALSEPLPGEVTPMVQAGELSSQAIWKAAESPDGRAALYNLDSDTGGVLVEWDGTLVMFSGWDFRTPQAIAPWMAVLDVRGSGTADTLVVDLYNGSGTGVSVETLHLLTRDDHGTITDHPLPQALYAERLPAIMTVKTGGNAAVSLGNTTLQLPKQQQKYTAGPCLGNIVAYTADRNGRLSMELALGMGVKDTAVPVYVGRLLADIAFDPDAGVYTLCNFTLGEG